VPRQALESDTGGKSILALTKEVREALKKG
jgi:hypothetical protein